MTYILFIIGGMVIFGLIHEIILKRRETIESAETADTILNEEPSGELMDQSNVLIKEEMRDNIMEKNENENVDNSEKWDTLALMECILTDLGCQPQRSKEDELCVAYQGENFIINIGGPYAQIWDPAWANISVKDPNFENMKTAANISNFDFGPSIVWTSPNEDGLVTLHSKMDILLSPQLQDNTSYIRSVLNSFFEKKERMRGQFHALINRPQDLTQNPSAGCVYN